MIVSTLITPMAVRIRLNFDPAVGAFAHFSHFLVNSLRLSHFIQFVTNFPRTVPNYLAYPIEID